MHWHSASLQVNIANLSPITRSIQKSLNNNIIVLWTETTFHSICLPFIAVFIQCNGSNCLLLSRSENLVTLLISYLFHWTWNKDYIVWPLLQLDLLHTLTYIPTPRTKLITGFVTRLTRRVPLVEQKLFILPEHLSTPPGFSEVCVARSLVLCVCFVDRCLSFCTFSFDHCVVCSSSIYGFWLPLDTLCQSLCFRIFLMEDSSYWTNDSWL